MENEKNILQYGVAIGIAHLIGVTSMIAMLGVMAVNIFIKLDDSLANLIISVLAGMGLIGLYSLLLKDKFIEIFKKFKSAETWKYIAIYFLLSFGCILIISVIYNALVPIEPTNSNEESLQKLVKYGALFYLYVIVIAPIAEEFIFRHFFFRLARYKGRKFAYILVIALFTLMHLISSIEVQSTNTVLLSPSFYLVFGSVRAIIPVAAILTLPSYLIPAGIMTYAVDKHDNLAIAIGVHVLNNILASITLAVSCLILIH